MSTALTIYVAFILVKAAPSVDIHFGTFCSGCLFAYDAGYTRASS